MASVIEDQETDRDEPLLAQRRRITVEEYHLMGDLGLLGEGRRCELIEGVIVDKMTKNPPHVLATDLIGEIFHRLVPIGFFVSMGNPLTVVERDSEPEPDAQILRGSPRDFLNRRRTQRDAALVVEVADSSYRIDRKSKWSTYAAAGVPIYWLLDLNRRRLEVHTGPIGDGRTGRYETTQLLGPDDEATIVLDGREVARFFVRDILP